MFSRTELLIGKEQLESLFEKKVVVFGIGGVGGYVVEALVRSGIGHFVLVDNDIVNLTNINRQIIALHSTIGRSKIEVMKERILDINPNVQVELRKCFFLPENSSEFDFSEYSYVVDAVDTVAAKIEIIVCAKNANVPVISCMGAGNKLDATKFQVADIYKTSVCPLARVMRRELKKRGIKNVKVVFSTETPATQKTGCLECASLQENSGLQKTSYSQKPVPASISFVPSVAGLIIASEVIKDLVFPNRLC